MPASTAAFICAKKKKDDFNLLRHFHQPRSSQSFRLDDVTLDPPGIQTTAAAALGSESLGRAPVVQVPWWERFINHSCLIPASFTSPPETSTHSPGSGMGCPPHWRLSEELSDEITHSRLLFCSLIYLFLFSTRAGFDVLLCQGSRTGEGQTSCCDVFLCAFGALMGKLRINWFVFN